MWRKYENLLPVLKELGITFVAHSPMANGFLTGKYNKSNSIFNEQSDYRRNMPQFKAESIDKNKELLDMLNYMADKKSATSAQISLAWLMAKGIVPIPGTRKPERLKENTGSADVTLSNEEVSAIDNALDNMEISEVFGGNKVK